MRAWPAGIRSKPVGARPDRRRTMTTKMRLRWLVKERLGLGKRLRLEASSFTVVAAIKEKAAAEEGEEGVDGDAKALLDTTATVPLKFKQPG